MTNQFAEIITNIIKFLLGVGIVTGVIATLALVWIAVMALGRRGK